jgi:hypothetical protein
LAIRPRRRSRRRSRPSGRAPFGVQGEFSDQADSFARDKPNLRLVSGGDRVNLVLTRYD